MSIDSLSLGGLFLFVLCLGCVSAYYYGRHTKKFRWSEYVAIFIAPLFLVLLYAWYIDTLIFKLFIASACLGFVTEYLLGLAYHKTLNKRLWNYSRLSLNGYTSLLSIPLWGIAGVLFWYLSLWVGL